MNEYVGWSGAGTVPLTILNFLWMCIKGLGLVIWSCVKYIFIGLFAVIKVIGAGILAVFSWIADWPWDAIGEFLLNCIKFPFKVIGKILKVPIDVLKWILSTFADVLVWLIKLAMLIITLRFISDPSSIGNLFKSKLEK